MGGRIDCYIDIASLYSYLGFAHLIKNLETLESHGVQVEFHPILLGAVNAKSGNKPPWTLPAKGRYLGRYELPRATAQFGRPQIRSPKDLLSMAHTILASVPITTFPLPPSRPPVSVSGAVQSSMFLIIKQVRLAKQPNRCLHHIKRNHPRETYHAVLERFFHGFWTPPHLNLTQVDILAAVLADTGRFSPEECEAIPAAAKEQEVKDMLTRSTQEALDRGAFGAPWLWVTNEEGREEPIFGSDRFHHVYKLLGLPYRDVELLPPGGKPKL